MALALFSFFLKLFCLICHHFNLKSCLYNLWYTKHMAKILHIIFLFRKHFLQSKPVNLLSTIQSTQIAPVQGDTLPATWKLLQNVKMVTFWKGQELQNVATVPPSVNRVPATKKEVWMRNVKNRQENVNANTVTMVSSVN